MASSTTSTATVRSTSPTWTTIRSAGPPIAAPRPVKLPPRRTAVCPAPEDIDRDGDGVFDYGDAIQVTWSDSWDDSLPTDCQGANQIDVDLDGNITPDEDHRCFDGLRNFNQVRPGVFDGGYAFADYSLDALEAAGRGDLVTKLNAFYANRIAAAGLSSAGIQRLPDAWMIPGEYIVEAATPAGYKLVKEEDKNVDFGDEYFPSTQATDPVCVGDLREVPPYLSFATYDGSGAADQVIPGFEGAQVDWNKDGPLSAARSNRSATASWSGCRRPRTRRRTSSCSPIRPSRRTPPA